MLSEQEVANAHCILVLAAVLIDARQLHRNISEHVHLAVELIVNFVVVKLRKVARDKGAVHGFEALGHCLGSAGMDVDEVVKLLQNGKVVVPKFDRRIEDKP